MKSIQPTTHPATSYDHSVGPPELQVSGEVGGRTAVFTLRPTFAESVDPGPLLGVAVHVATHFRIPLTFTATFNQVTGERWELVRVLCDQDDYLSSVRTVRPQVAACAARVLEEQRAQMEPLLAVAREREAAYALAEVYRARTAAADAHRRVDAAEDEFGLFEVCEERAAAVITQLSRRPGALPHAGPPVVRSTSYGLVLILCPVGHLVQSVKAEDWTGSQLAARCADPAFTVTCHGQTGESLPH
ncbi:hypothetical protein [Streptomyces sp. FL07-04A]|uniref:hypothetical protein n=1 Tax=Streptomyces sp. FL07-04A TaxID=3028658 RepID=UPI0029AC068D|nr:hypothetical protein [Streptomyces sp. FL07-04A]MDX3578144.1 hypothetical protein [Streptomyces sp. FL07-04A]